MRTKGDKGISCRVPMKLLYIGKGRNVFTYVISFFGQLQQISKHRRDSDSGICVPGCVIGKSEREFEDEECGTSPKSSISILGYVCILNYVFGSRLGYI